MSEPEDRISDLYQASKTRASPPAELDARILAEAHRLVSRKRGWHMGAIGAAATVLLGVGLAWFHLGVPPTLSPEPVTEQISPAPAPAASRQIMHSAEDAAAQAPTAYAEKRAFSPINPEIKTSAGGFESVPDSSGLDVGPVRSSRYTDRASVCGIELRIESKSAWRAAIDAARASGDTELEDCLSDALRGWFKDEPNRQ